PASGHVDEELPVVFKAVTARRTVSPLIVFALVPECTADAVRELCLPHAPQQTAVDRAEIRRIARVALVLIDPRSADRPVEEADRHLFALDQPTSEFLGPATDVQFAAIAPRDCITPLFEVYDAGTAVRAAERANPGARDLVLFRPPIGRDGVGLPVDQVCV